MGAASRGVRGALLDRQRAAVERLRRELFGPDGSLRHPYFRELRTGFRRHCGPASRDRLIRRCARADVVFVGDFHAVPECQAWTADLLAALAARVPRLALGVEFVYTRQQNLLDRRQAGRLDDVSFLRRIHYREEWGYPWEGFRGLLDRARALDVPVWALDTPPRGGFDGLARRDEHAARRIAAILADEPRTKLVVLFGESHVTRRHIPRRVDRLGRALGRSLRSVIVFQDPEAVYWALLGQGATIPPVAEFEDDLFAVFHTPPLEKYEAYRQVLDRWRGDVPPDEEVDLTPAVHHLLRVLQGWLGIRTRRLRVRHRAGWVEELEDAYPEVYSGPEAEALLMPILEEHGRSEEEILEAQELFRGAGALYEPRSNTMFLARYRPACAAAEGARFLRAALSGRLFEPAEDGYEDPVARTYGAAYNEALSYLGARLVDPLADRLLEAKPADPDGGRPAVDDALVGLRVDWLEAHRRFEVSREKVLPRELSDPLLGPRPIRRALARDLGHRLGRLLYEQTRAGRLSARALRQLFSRRLDAVRTRSVVLDLLRGSPVHEQSVRAR